MANAEQLISIWNADSTRRLIQQNLRDYYKGEQEIAELNTARVDRRTKSKVKSKWVRYATDFHTGLLTTKDINYVLDDSAGKSALDGFYEVIQANDVNTLDSEHLANCLLYGFSVEVHSFAEDIKISKTDPVQWSFVRNEYGEVVIAIYRVECAKNSIYQGELLLSDKILYYVYDTENVSVIEKVGSSYNTLEVNPHQYGRLPIVIFTTSPDSLPFFSINFLKNCDAYDVIRSSHIDDIRFNIDALLKMRGIHPKELLSDIQLGVDADGKAISAKIVDLLREQRILALPGENADAEFISRSVDVEKIKYDLEVSRQAIHMMAAIPDITGHINQLGNITEISGVALRMRYQPTLMTAGRFTKYYEKGLRDRIKLVNRVWEIQRKPALAGYDIKVEQYIPQSETEILQYIAGVKDIIPDKELLKMIPFVEKPEKAYEELQAQRANQSEIAA